MSHHSGRVAVVVAVLAGPAGAAPVLYDLESPQAVSDVLTSARRAALTATPPPGTPAGFAAPENGQSAPPAAPIRLFDEKSWDSLPVPDQATLDWLKSRVPDMDLPKVRVVSPEHAGGALARAVSAGANYLDIMSHPGFQEDRLYLVPRASLDFVDKRYAPGTLPISGKTKDDKPFVMEAFVAGQGKLEFLYDHDGFEFEDNGRSYRVAKGSRVSCRILGPGDVGVSGLKVHAFLWKWATIQRMTRIGPAKVKVETDMGSGEGDINPIRVKAAP